MFMGGFFYYMIVHLQNGLPKLKYVITNFHFGIQNENLSPPIN